MERIDLSLEEIREAVDAGLHTAYGYPMDEGEKDRLGFLTIEITHAIRNQALRLGGLHG